jgi:hypothetical protein
MAPAGKSVFVPEVLASAGKAFVAMDRILDRAVIGPSYLSVPQIAELVVWALRAGEVPSGGIGFIRNYIERNPVKAGLVAAAEEFRWSSAYPRRAA